MTAKRMQTLRARRKAQGLVRVEVWVPKENVADVRLIVLRINEAANTGIVEVIPMQGSK